MANEYCQYGFNKLLRFVKAVQEEIGGIRNNESIECVHRMRVASRRTRTALRLFDQCFPDKMAVKWRKSIKRITRTLGEARDLDVQIEWLDNMFSNPKSKNYQQSIQYLKQHLARKRLKIQENLIALINKLEKNHVLSDIIDRIIQNKVAQPVDSKMKTKYFYQQARRHIRVRLKKLLKYNRYIDKADRYDKFHQMRIAAKRTRYTIEIFAPVYDCGMDKALAFLRKTQKLLGDIHDCTVWLDMLPKFLHREKKHIMKYRNREHRFAVLESAIKFLVDDRQSKRSKTYHEFRELWQRLRAEFFWKKFENYLNVSIQS